MSYRKILKELTNFDTQTTPKGVFNTAFFKGGQLVVHCQKDSIMI